MSVSEGEQLPPAKYPSHSVACCLASLLVSQPFFSVNLHASRCIQHVCPHALGSIRFIPHTRGTRRRCLRLYRLVPVMLVFFLRRLPIQHNAVPGVRVKIRGVNVFYQ